MFQKNGLVLEPIFGSLITPFKFRKTFTYHFLASVILVKYRIAYRVWLQFKDRDAEIGGRCDDDPKVRSLM